MSWLITRLEAARLDPACVIGQVEVNPAASFIGQSHESASHKPAPATHARSKVRGPNGRRILRRSPCDGGSNDRNRAASRGWRAQLEHIGWALSSSRRSRGIRGAPQIGSENLLIGVKAMSLYLSLVAMTSPAIQGVEATNTRTSLLCGLTLTLLLSAPAIAQQFQGPPGAPATREFPELAHAAGPDAAVRR